MFPSVIFLSYLLEETSMRAFMFQVLKTMANSENTKILVPSLPF